MAMVNPLRPLSLAYVGKGPFASPRPVRTRSRPLPLDRMCIDVADAQMGVPLHSAAERFWRECGYLR